MTLVKETPQQPKISKNDFRKMMNNEIMLNGKRFQDCSRFELLEMLMSLSKAVNILQTELKTYKEPKVEEAVELTVVQ